MFTEISDDSTYCTNEGGRFCEYYAYKDAQKASSFFQSVYVSRLIRTSSGTPVTRNHRYAWAFSLEQVSRSASVNSSFHLRLRRPVLHTEQLMVS